LSRYDTTTQNVWFNSIWVWVCSRNCTRRLDNNEELQSESGQGLIPLNCPIYINISSPHYVSGAFTHFKDVMSDKITSMKEKL